MAARFPGESSPNFSCIALGQESFIMIILIMILITIIMMILITITIIIIIIIMVIYTAQILC